MSSDRVRRTIAEELPFSISSRCRSVFATPEDVINSSGGKVSISSDSSLVVSPDAYADDFIGLLRNAWKSRPDVNKKGTPDSDIYTMLQATLLVFDAAAIRKHGYSQSKDQAAEQAHTGILSESMGQVFGDVLAALQRTNDVLRQHSQGKAIIIH